MIRLGWNPYYMLTNSNAKHGHLFPKVCNFGENVLKTNKEVAYF